MKKAMRILVPILLAIAVIGCMIWYLFVYDRDFTRDMLLNQARYQEREGNHAAAAWFYDLAYSHADNDENVAIELADQYRSSGNYTKAEFTISNAIADGPTAELYTKLCQLYVEQDKLLDAVKMLDSISDPVIKAKLDEFRPAAPAASVEPGFYTQYMTVELSCPDSTLYVSTEGEYPSVEDVPYADPIQLGAGETTIYCVAVNEKGLVSPLSIFGYTVGGVVEPVKFADAAIEAEIRALLNAGDNKVIYTNELWEITEFSVPAEATTLADLQYLTYLESLTLDSTVTESLAFLSAMDHLQELILLNGKPTQEDLAQIAAIPTLTRLTMADCNLSSIEALENAHALTYLDLNGNTIRNISVLNSMPNLQELYMAHNALTDLGVLSSITSLQKLDVSYNSISSIAPICSITGLTWLDVSNNKLTNLGAADNLKNLTYFAAAYNSLDNVSQLSQCSKLEILNISNNLIIDISGLGALNSLQELNFSNNQVLALPVFDAESALVAIDGSHNMLDSLSSLSGLKKLNNVYMDYNEEIKSVTGLEKCPRLLRVSVYGTQVSDVSKLTDQSIEVNYNPTES